MNKYKQLLEDLYPLHRTLVSDDTDVAFKIIIEFLKGLGLGEEDCILHQFPTGENLSTWIAPQKYSLKNISLSAILNLMKKLMTKHFSRWAAKQKIPKRELANSLTEITDGSFEANLGGHLYKKKSPF